MPCLLNCIVVPSNDSWCHYIPFSLVLIDVEISELGKVSKPLARSAHWGVCVLSWKTDGTTVTVFQIFYLSSQIAADDVDAEATFCPKGHWCNQHSISTNSVFAVHQWAVSHSAHSEQLSNTSELGMVAFIVKCYLCMKTEPDWSSHFSEGKM